MHHHFIVSLLYIISMLGFKVPLSKIIAPAAIEYAFVEGSTFSVNGKTNVKPFNCIYFYNEMLPKSQTTIFANTDSSVFYFKNAILNVNVEALNCGDNGINNDLCRVLKANKHPNIFVRIKDAISVSNQTIDLSRQTELKVDADISMAGVTRQDSIIMEGKQIGGNLFHFTGKHILYMTDFGIKPPTALFGLIKVHNDLVIRFDLKVRVHIIS